MTRRAAHTPRRTRAPRRFSLPQRAPRLNSLALFLFASLCCLLAGERSVFAAPLADYRERARAAAEWMEELHRTFDETDDVSSPAFLDMEKRVFENVRKALPAREKIEGAGGLVLDVDNRWLHDELDLYGKTGVEDTRARDELLMRISERLRALDARLAETADANDAAVRDKEAEKGRLNSILQRPEYNEQAAEDSALARLWKRFKQWLESLMPKSSPVGERTANTFSAVARLFVFALAAAVIFYVLWKYGAHLLPRNRAAKKTGKEARVVLAERLAPGQTAADLIDEAERLARAGDLRGAIRKAYIAVLVELGERRILRLAAHKTNRDYLSAIRRERSALYGDMQPLTHNYERHWYGFAPATNADWHDFQTRCRQAIKVSG